MLINPINFRLSISIFWNSTWSLYKNYNYKYLFYSDLVFFEFFMFFFKKTMRLKRLDLYPSHIRLYRLTDKIIVNLYYHIAKEEFYFKEINLIHKNLKKKIILPKKKKRIEYNYFEKPFLLYIIKKNFLNFFLKNLVWNTNINILKEHLKYLWKYIKNYFSSKIWNVIKKYIKKIFIYFYKIFIYFGLKYKEKKKKKYINENKLNKNKLNKKDLELLRKISRLSIILKKRKKIKKDIKKDIEKKRKKEKKINKKNKKGIEENIEKYIENWIENWVEDWINDKKKKKIYINESIKKKKNIEKNIEKDIKKKNIKKKNIGKNIKKRLENKLKKNKKNKRIKIKKKLNNYLDEIKKYFLKIETYDKLNKIKNNILIINDEEDNYLNINDKNNDFNKDNKDNNFNIEKENNEGGNEDDDEFIDYNLNINNNNNNKDFNYLYKINFLKFIYNQKLWIFNLFYYFVSKYFKKFNKNFFSNILKNFELNFFKINMISITSNVITKYIISSLRNNYSVHESLKPVLIDLKERIRRKKIAGFKITVSGRFKRAERATYWWRKDGHISTGTQLAAVDYSTSLHKTKYGVCSIHIWLTLGMRGLNQLIQEYPSFYPFFFLLKKKKINYFIFKKNNLFFNNILNKGRIQSFNIRFNYVKGFIIFLICKYLYLNIFLKNISIKNKINNGYKVNKYLQKIFLPQYLKYKIYLEEYLKQNYIKIVPFIQLKYLKRINLRNSYKINFLNKSKLINLKKYKYRIYLY